MAKQTFTAGQVLTAAEMNSLQENDYNWTVTTKTASYTLAAGDEGTRIVMNNAGATTITVDDAVFAAGDVVWLHNIGAGTCTVTAGTATVNTAASLDLAQWEGGSLFFTSASSAIFFRGAGGVGTANFTDTATGTYSSGGTNYKYLTFTASGTITIDTAGLADILVIGGGGGGGNAGAGGGGAGGMLEGTGVYLPVGTLTVVVGAGGAAPTASSNNTVRGLAGIASSIDGVYFAPGGAGGMSNTRNATGSLRYDIDGDNGGSGSGAPPDGTGGAGISGLGNDGGDSTATNAGGGGGGGAGAAGQDGTPTSVAGDGGNGRSSSITGSAVTYAGGGGGGGTSGGAGGTGGGGTGGAGGSVTAGTANTGGGGGSNASGNLAGGGAGGSGIVVVRVEV